MGKTAEMCSVHVNVIFVSKYFAIRIIIKCAENCKGDAVVDGITIMINHKKLIYV